MPLCWYSRDSTVPTSEVPLLGQSSVRDREASTSECRPNDNHKTDTTMNHIGYGKEPARFICQKCSRCRREPPAQGRLHRTYLHLLRIGSGCARISARSPNVSTPLRGLCVDACESIRMLHNPVSVHWDILAVLMAGDADASGDTCE